MQRKGVPMLYERLLVPSLYVCPVENVLGWVPLIPCYLKGNKVNTIPHCFWDQRKQQQIQDQTLEDSKLQKFGIVVQLREVCTMYTISATIKDTILYLVCKNQWNSLRSRGPI